MSAGTAIEWARDTWNPVTGCDRVSRGCDYCYAQTLAKRLKAMGNPRYQRDGNDRTSGPGFGVTLHPDKLMEPLRRRQPTVLFVNSMSDLFHDDVPNDFIARAFAVMAHAERQVFQVLTKRPRRMARLLASPAFTRAVEGWSTDIVEGVTWEDLGVGWPLPNVWLGASVEDQKWADLRIPHLLRTPAAVRFLSCEPLLGSVDLNPWLEAVDGQAKYALDWVIVGGESGVHLWRAQDRALVTYDPRTKSWVPKREAVGWVRALRDQCQAAGVSFFFKQWGGNVPKAGGRELDGRLWNEMPNGAAALVNLAPELV